MHCRMRAKVLKRFLREVDLFQKEEEEACHFTKNSKREDEHALAQRLKTFPLARFLALCRNWFIICRVPFVLAYWKPK
jgi:hypothetical protein